MNNNYNLLNYDLWNRRLLNLLWIFNAIILVVEIIVAFRYYQTEPMPPLQLYAFEYVLLPSSLVFLIIAICEVSVLFLKNCNARLQPYAISLASVAICGVLLIIHYYVTVVFVVYCMPMFFSLIYNNKRVLLFTYISSLVVFIAIYEGYFIRAELPNFIVNVANIPANMALLFVAYLIGRVILVRQEELNNIVSEVASDKFRAEAALEMRTRFLANMSHEIRTPMNGIIGLTELALDGEKISSAQEDYLLKIQNCAKGLLSVINDILDISKIDAGELCLESIPFDLHTVFSECYEIIRLKAEEKGLSLHIIDRVRLRNKIIGDPTKLRQALLNLLSNAIKFTVAGSASLLARCEGVSEGGDKVSIYFEISDTGIGITEEHCKNIFEPFKQADNGTTRIFGGTGLGLAITSSIINKMGGHINVESTPGKGSRFFFKLWFSLSEEESMPSEIYLRNTANEKLPVFHGEVLLCEDNEINRQVALENLRKMGLNVTIAENGQVGVDIAIKREKDKKPFDIIFMDVHMPVMDGLQAMKVLAENNIKAPVIAMTANVMPDDRDKYSKSGMTDYICKPFSSRELWSCLGKYLISDENCPPVDKTVGISYAAEDIELYNKILLKFSEEQCDIPYLLESAIKEKEYVRAYDIAHSAKGVALTIGAIKLARIIEVIEHVLREDVDSYKDSMMHDYKVELKNVLDFISVNT